MTIRIETADGTVAFAEDARAFFDERLDVVDEFLFVEFFLRGAVCFVDELSQISIISGASGTDIPL